MRAVAADDPEYARVADLPAAAVRGAVKPSPKRP
jgi:hypothetical protein